MAVSPAEDILRTLTYDYITTVGSARYSQNTGSILCSSTTGNINNKLSFSCFIIGNGTTKNITSNGHYYLSFNTGSSSSNRMLDINLKMTSSNGMKLLDVKYSFKNLGANKTYTLTLDVDGFTSMGFSQPRLYNMTLVLGKVSYTYDNVFGPIATCSDIFAATGLEPDDSPETPSEVVYAANNKNTQVIINTDRTYEFEFFIINNPSQTYSNKQAVRYADLKKDTWRSSSI